MEVKATVDMTIPLWGILLSLMTGVYYIIKLSFSVESLKKEMAQIRITLKKVKD